MKKKKLLVFVTTLLCIIAKAQTPYYYYYKDEKIYLTLNTQYAFLSLREPQLPVNIQQRGIIAENILDYI